MSLNDIATKKVGWRQRRLGSANMTAIQFMALQDLAEMKKTGFPFLALDILHPRTIRSMIRQDWIVKSVSKHDSSVMYAITGRGERMLQRFAQNYCRKDGRCPRCDGQREREITRTGEVAPYCSECHSDIYYRQKELGFNYSHSKPGMCICGKHWREVTPSGFVKTYCKACNRRERKSYKKRKFAQLRARIKAGERLMCKCGKGERYIQPSGRVTDQCLECQRSYRKAWYQKQEPAPSHQPADTPARADADAMASKARERAAGE